MVLARNAGRKTQTRRVVPHIPMLGEPLAWCAAAKAEEPGWVHIVGDYRRFCPYGQPGERLWVREAHEITSNIGALVKGRYLADGAPFNAMLTPREFALFRERKRPWGVLPARFMYRSLSRGLDEIVAVRVERVQDISEEDAKAEGIDVIRDEWAGACGDFDESLTDKQLFEILWDSINATRGYSWESNPWVWVIEFRRVQPTESEASHR